MVKTEKSKDLISRADAIEAVVCHIWHTPNEVYRQFNCENVVREVVEDAIKRIPSAETLQNLTKPNKTYEVVRCGECRFYLQSNEKCELVDTRLHFYETDKTWTGDCYCSWGERKEP